MLGIAQLQCAILICVLCHTCSTAACSCRCNRCTIMLRATCNMRICVLTWFWMHDCTVQILLHTFCTIIICIALCYMCSICSACWQGRGAAQMQILLMQQSKRICRCKCNCSPGTSTYLVIHHFLARQAGLAPLRTVHSLALLTAPWVPRLQLNCCIQRYSACLPAILAPNHRHFSSTYLGSLDNQHVCGLFCHT